MLVFTTSNQKGGVGKTVFACSFAKYLGGEGKEVIFYKMATNKQGKKYRDVAFRKTLPNKRVLFIDFDPQKNGSSVFQETGFTGLHSYDFITQDCTVEPSESGVTLIKADERLKDAHLFNATSVAQFMQSNLKKIDNIFDYVIVDTPPTENLIVRCVFVVSNYLIAPIVPVKFSIDGIGSMLQLIFGMKKQFNPDLEFLGMLPCKVLGNVEKANDDNPESVKRLKMQQAALRDLASSPYGPLLLLSEKKQLVGISERQIIEVAISSGEAVWESKGAEALASTREFFSVFDAIEHKIGGF